MKSKIEDYFDRLWSITRSLTGDGNRESLQILSELIDLEINEARFGTKCFDWNVPPEWNIKEAWIKIVKEIKLLIFEKIIYIYWVIRNLFMVYLALKSQRPIYTPCLINQI